MIIGMNQELTLKVIVNKIPKGIDALNFKNEHDYAINFILNSRNILF